jgi:hypothetical protein
MDQYELGVALAVAHLTELRRHADRRLAGRVPGRTARRRDNRAPGVAMGPRATRPGR